MSRPRSRSLPPVAVLLLASAAAAQTPLVTVYGEAAGDRAGEAVLGGLDSDGDGRSELILGAPGADLQGKTDNGAVLVAAGGTGALLATLHGPNSQDGLGTSLGLAGDVDQDGTPDFIAGAPNGFASGARPGLARVYSGADLVKLVTYFGQDDGSRFGQSVAGGLESFTSGLLTDVLVGAPDGGYLQHGSVFRLEGPTGKVVYELIGLRGQAGSDYGWSVANAGLVDFYPDPEFLIGRPDHGAGSGSAELFEVGANQVWYGASSFGWDVEGDLDVNGDGVADQAVSMPFEQEGIVYVYDGATKGELASFRGQAPGDGFGRSISKLGDLNGDGFDELVVGSDAGYVRVIDPARSQVVLTLQGEAGDVEFGYAVAGLGDFDGDGLLDFAVGAPGSPNLDGDAGAGLVRVYSSAPWFVSYCTAGTSASGCQASISGAGVPSATASSGFDLLAAGVEGDKRALFFFGSSGRQANAWGTGTSFQCVTPPVKRGGVMDKNGTAGACDGAYALDLNAQWCPSCPKPGQNPGAGAVVQAQLWYRDPQSSSNQSTSLSDALELVVAP